MEFGHRFSFLISAILLSLGHGISATKLCQKDGFWYDADNGKCRPCVPCGPKSLELEPCSEFRNTMCVDLTLFKFDFVGGQRSGPSTTGSYKPKHHSWHEMETMGSEDEDDNNVIMEKAVEMRQQERFQDSPSKMDHYSLWDVGVVVVLCLTLAAVLIAMVVTIVRQPGRWSSHRGDNRIKKRSRLFSRDRLSTTEYMNNLATLDRRQAMDEILEKRKKAIFEPPHLLNDDIFVDISGTIPRHFGDENEHDSSRSLLLTATHSSA